MGSVFCSFSDRDILIFIAAMLLNLACSKPKTSYADQQFVLLDADDHGITHSNDLVYSEEFNVYLYKSFYNGAGVGVGDLNNDGFVDLFFATNQSGNKVYLNQGNFNFRDVTIASQVSGEHSWYTGVSIIDVNGDGLLDVFLCKGGRPTDNHRRNELWINQGVKNGIPIFLELANAFGVDDIGFSVHAIFFDYDGDDDLDFYLLNNSISPSDVVIDAKFGMRNKHDANGNKLYRNDGSRFTDVTLQSGIYSSAIGFGLGASVGDLNRDGWPDLYVANDFFERDYLYLNQKDGTFKEVIEQCASEISLGSMGVDIGDMNNDGWPEIFVTEMLPRDERRLKTKVLFDNWDTYSLKLRNGYFRQFARNTFQLNNGVIGSSDVVSFTEISRYADVAATDWSWGVLMADFDNDGLKDLYITNGIVKDLLDQDYLDFYTNPERLRTIYAQKGAVIKELIDSIPSEPLSNFLYHQDSTLTFSDLTRQWGLDHSGFSTGSAYADFDNDGDLDLIVSNINQKPFLYKNMSDTAKAAATNFLNLTLRGKGKNVMAVGAQVTLKAGGKQFFQELFPMRGAMSTVDSRLHFGLGNVSRIDTLEIRWPNHLITIRHNVPVNQFLTITQDAKTTTVDKERMVQAPLFVERSLIPDWQVHRRRGDFNDFNYDVLMPFMVSNTGPSLAVGDVNNDGLSDFYLGGSREQPGSLFVQYKSGKFFRSVIEAFLKDSIAEDSDAVFFDVDGDGDNDLMVASGSYEVSPNSFALANRIYVNDGSGNFKRSPLVLPANKLVNTSVIEPSDVDGDGDMDLFIGSYCKPQQYGVDGSHFFLINNGAGKFQDKTSELAEGFKNLGMVTDAVWLDYDNDGDEDLIVVGHWMPVTVYQNNEGKLKDVSRSVGLGASSGLWNAVEKYDIDGDGRLDLICGNWGTNAMFKATHERPLKLYVNDFDNNGSVEGIVSAYDGDDAYPIVTKKDLVSRLPGLKKKYLKHRDYALKKMDDIFSSEQLAGSKVKTVSTMKSCVLWNESYGFVTQELPMQAQLAPIYSFLVDDFDDDGVKEILIGGNQFLGKPQLGIYAGSYALALKANRHRDIWALPQSASGLRIDGEVRSIRLIDDLHFGKRALFGVCGDSVRLFELNEAFRSNED